MWQSISDLGNINWAALHDPVMVFRIGLQVVLFALSALFSMSETALFSLREADLQRLEQNNPPKALMLRRLLDEPRQLIISILCGNELINIAATVNLAGIFLALYDNTGTAVLANTLVMLPLLLLFGEITPKTAAVQQPVLICTKLVGPVINYWVKIVAPLRAVIRVIADFFTTLIIGDAPANNHILGADEFRTMLSDIEASGTVNPAERQLIVNLIDAGSRDVKQVMVPRPLVNFIDASASVPEMIAQFRQFRHRRVPVFETHRDNVVGILQDVKVLELVENMPIEEITKAQLLSSPYIVPDTTTLSYLAEFFKDDQHHAAVVVNEFGGVEGLVSADDVFGYLTHGHSTYLRDNSDVIEISEDELECRGLTSIDALHHATNIPVDELPVATVGGYLMLMSEKHPKVGDVIETENWVFEVLSMDKLLVDRIRITSVGLAEDEAEEAAEEAEEVQDIATEFDTQEQKQSPKNEEKA